MSIESYLFKSTKENIYNIDEVGQIKSDFKSINSSGIDPTTLSQLESILTGEDCYNIYEKGDYSIFHRFDDEGGPVFIRSSTNLIKCLKELSLQRKNEILERWCQTQEMSLYGWTPEKAERIINWLIDASSDQSSNHEEIFLFLDIPKETVQKIS